MAEEALDEAVLVAAYDKLSGKPDEELYVLVGAGVLGPDEYLSAALATWAPDAIASDLERDGLFGTGAAIDLIQRGKSFVETLVNERNQALRERICPAYEQTAERDLILGAAPLISDLYLTNAGILDPTGAVVVAICFLLIRYGLAKFCTDFRGGPPGFAAA